MTLRCLLAATIVAVSLSVTPVHAKDLIVGLSPFQSQDVHKTQVKTLLAYLCRQNDFQQVVFVDAYHLKTIGHFNIPEGGTYQSAKARLRVNSELVARLLRFGGDVPASQNQDDLPQTVGAVRLPQLSDYIAGQFSGVDKTLLLVGSPVYDVPADKAFSMVGQVYPSDAHILANHRVSVFGTADTPSLLDGLKVYWVSTYQSYQNSQYSYLVERFWSLYISHQSGRLIRMAEDLSGVLDNLGQPPNTFPDRFSLDKTARLEMIRLREQDPVVVEPDSEKSPSAEPDPQHARRAEITLSWDCEACDLDLYVQLENGKILYFGNTETRQATFYKEIRDLSAPNKGFETVVFKQPVDLTQLNIAVNFFSGIRSGGVHGIVTFRYDGVTVEQPFHITATKGNGVSDLQSLLNSHDDRDHLYQINPAKLLKWREGADL